MIRCWLLGAGHGRCRFGISGSGHTRWRRTRRCGVRLRRRCRLGRRRCRRSVRRLPRSGGFGRLHLGYAGRGRGRSGTWRGNRLSGLLRSDRRIGVLPPLRRRPDVGHGAGRWRLRTLRTGNFGRRRQGRWFGSRFAGRGSLDGRLNLLPLNRVGLGRDLCGLALRLDRGTRRHIGRGLGHGLRRRRDLAALGRRGALRLSHLRGVLGRVLPLLRLRCGHGRRIWSDLDLAAFGRRGSRLLASSSDVIGLNLIGPRLLSLGGDVHRFGFRSGRHLRLVHLPLHGRSRRRLG